jgi:hypothetical protein
MLLFWQRVYTAAGLWKFYSMVVSRCIWRKNNILRGSKDEGTILNQIVQTTPPQKIPDRKSVVPYWYRFG